MNSTIFLSQLMGLFFLVTGLSLLGGKTTIMGMFKQFFTNRAITYLFGVITLITSLALVLKHNIWTGTPAIVISILGWIIFLDSIIYLFMPQSVLKVFLEWIALKKVYYGHALIHIILGGYLIYVGFLAQ